MKVEIVPAKIEHLIDLVERMRERERSAFEQLGENPEKVLTQELAKSIVSYTGLVDGKVAVVCGARSEGLLAADAYVWITCTDLVEQHPLVFLRHTRKVLAMLHQYFDTIHGLVLADFYVSVRWLEWLGFAVGEPQGGVRTFVHVQR